MSALQNFVKLYFAVCLLLAVVSAGNLNDTCSLSVNTCAAGCRLLDKGNSFKASCNGESNSCQCGWSQSLASNQSQFCAAQKKGCETLCSPASGAPKGTKVDSFSCDGVSGSVWCQCSLDWNRWSEIRDYHNSTLNCASKVQECFNTTCADKKDTRAYCTTTGEAVCDCEGHRTIDSNSSATFMDNVTYVPPSDNSTSEDGGDGSPKSGALGAAANGLHFLALSATLLTAISGFNLLF